MKSFLHSSAIVLKCLAIACFLSSCSLDTISIRQDLDRTNALLDSIKNSFDSRPERFGASENTGTDQSVKDLRMEMRLLAFRVDSLQKELKDMMPRKAVYALMKDVGRSRGMAAAGSDAGVPDHEWVGTALRFRTPGGSWGKLVDLRGESGTGSERASRGATGSSGLGPVRVFPVSAGSSAGMSKAQQTQSGLVVGTIKCGRNGRGVLRGSGGDMRVTASAHWRDFGENINVFVTDDSFVLPVSAGSGWSVSSHQWEGSVEATVYWIPLN